MRRHASAVFSASLLLVASSALSQEPADRAFLYDRVLGSLVGSAIGDAMGAPTEMWSRDQIQAEYGVNQYTADKRVRYHFQRMFVEGCDHLYPLRAVVNLVKCSP